MGATISVCEHEIFSQCMQYSLQKTYYDNKLGIVEYTLLLKCQNKTLAICTIQAYVRANFELDMQEDKKISCEFQGKTVLIIGGTKGIGAELAKKYALGGSRVLLTYCHDEEKAEEVKKKIQKYNQNVKLYRGDMRDYSDCKTAWRWLTPFSWRRWERAWENITFMATPPDCRSTLCIMSVRMACGHLCPLSRGGAPLLYLLKYPL